MKDLKTLTRTLKDSMKAVDRFIIMSQRYFDMAKEKSKTQSKIQAKTQIKSSKQPKAAAKVASKSKIVVKSKVQAKTQIKTQAKPAVKSVAKPAAKPILKTVVKPAASKLIKKETKSVVTKKTDVASKKSLEKKSDIKKSDTKVVAEVKSTPTTVVKNAKVDTKAKPAKIKKTEKKETADFDDDLTLDDDFGDSEISDYEDDLKSVEELDEEDFTEVTEDDDEERKDEEIYLTDSEGRRLCRVRDCDQVATVDGYCRFHYLLLWKKIQIRKSILLDGKLEKYIEDLTSRYPDKFLEMIRKDLKSDKEFLAAIQELEIDESALNEMDNNDEETQSFADEIRGIGDAPGMDEDGDY